LSFLLEFIQGKGRFKLFGTGIRTYPFGDENNKNIHKGCLKLEQRNLIKRDYEENVGKASHMVVWVPIKRESKQGAKFKMLGRVAKARGISRPYVGSRLGILPRPIKIKKGQGG